MKACAQDIALDHTSSGARDQSTPHVYLVAEGARSAVCPDSFFSRLEDAHQHYLTPRTESLVGSVIAVYKLSGWIFHTTPLLGELSVGGRGRFFS